MFSDAAWHLMQWHSCISVQTHF